MALRHFAWQAWHLVTSTFVSRARRGTWRHLPAFGVAGVALVALGGALGRRWSPGGTAPLCVAGVALGDIHLRFTWQAWHWRTWSPLVARSATPLCHNFVTRSLSHTTFTHTIFHTHNFVTHTIFLCHTTSFIYDFVTHHFFYLSILHHLLCLSFLPRPPYNMCGSLLEEVDLWGYPVLSFVSFAFVFVFLQTVVRFFFALVFVFFFESLEVGLRHFTISA